MPDDSYVQVATDGSGKKIRNRKLTEPTAVDASGNAQADTVSYQQVVTTATKRGDYLDRTDEVLEALAAINESLTLLLAIFEP